MPEIIMPPWKYNPYWRMVYELRKKKRLEWAKKFGCYEEVKKYYEIKEKLLEHTKY